MSVRIASVAVGLVLVFVASTAAAQTPAPPVPMLEARANYVSGKPGFKHRIWQGQITIAPDGLVFAEGSTRGFRIKYFPRFTIPLLSITEVTTAVSRSDYEQVLVTTETATSIDVVIFEVKNDTSAATAAKIGFAVRHAKEAAGFAP